MKKWLPKCDNVNGNYNNNQLEFDKKYHNMNGNYNNNNVRMKPMNSIQKRCHPWIVPKNIDTIVTKNIVALELKRASINTIADAYTQNKLIFSNNMGS